MGLSVGLVCVHARPLLVSPVHTVKLCTGELDLDKGDGEGSDETAEPEQSSHDDYTQNDTQCNTSENEHPEKDGNSINNISPQNPKPRIKHWRHKRTKAWWNIETINMKGWGASDMFNANSKWQDINRIVHEKKISLLTLQETHLSDTHVEDIHKIYGKRL